MKTLQKAAVIVFLCLSCIWNLNAQVVVTESSPWVEGFEGNGTNFPTGWTQENMSASGTMQWGINQGGAHQGEYSAVISFAFNAQKVRLITPVMDLTGISNPILKFFQLATGSSPDILTVYIRTSSTAEWQLVKMYETGATNWTEETVNLPDPTATYQIAFEATLGNGNGIWLDDILVEQAPSVPSIAGAASISFGTVYKNLPFAIAKSYAVQNTGTVPLVINAVTSANPEISIAETMPVTIQPSATAHITVKIDAEALSAGAFNGGFTIKSNDPETPDFDVDVTATVFEAAHISNFIDETFNDRDPEGWTYNRFIRFTSGGGVGNTTCLRGMLHTGNTGVGSIQTGYVKMGEYPSISFNYRARLDSIGVETNAATDQIRYELAISKDNGLTWDTVLKTAFGEHGSTNDHKKIDFNADAYAGEVCIVRFQFYANTARLNSKQQINLYFDDVVVGTEPMNELAAAFIRGNQTPLPENKQIYTVSVTNKGAMPQIGLSYSVRLMKEDGTQLASVPGVNIENLETKEFQLEWTPSQVGPVKLYGEVVLANDEFPDNNKTAMLQVDVLSSTVQQITIGTGTQDYKIPYNLSYNQSLSQTVYYPHELSTNSGEIRALIYQAAIDEARAAYENVEIQVWIGETDKTDLREGWIAPESLTEVFDGTLSFPKGEYNVTVPFHTPYEYKGGVLVVYSYRKNNGLNGGNYFVDYFKGTAIPNSFRSVSYSAFSGAVNPTEPPTFDAGVHGIPNTTFVIDMKDMGKLSGVVTDGTGPIADADIRVLGTQYRIKSDSVGNYVFPNLAAGTLSIEFSKFGFYTDTIDIVITTNTTTTENVALTAIPQFTLSGKIIGTSVSGGLEGAMVRLVGYDNYSVTTNATGDYSISGVYAGFTYKFDARLTGYYIYDTTINMPFADHVHNLLLDEKPFPVTDLTTTLEDSKAVITWGPPAGFDGKTYIYDDNVDDAGVTSGTGGATQWYGTRFNVGEVGELIGIDLYGVGELEVTQDMPRVTIDIFNENRELVASSDPFQIPLFEWVNVPLNDVPYSNVFYVMVKWTSEASAMTNFIGFDLDGPAASDTTDWGFNGIEWKSIAETMNGVRGVFMIRANVNEEITSTANKAATYASDNLQRTAGSAPKNAQPAKPFATVNHPDFMKINQSVNVSAEYAKHAAKAVPAPSPVGHKIYRLLQGQEEGAWSELNEVGTTVTTYTDTDFSSLDDGAYQYAVKTKYKNDVWSRAVLSNIVGKGMEVSYTVNLTTNSGDDVAGAIVTLSNQDSTHTLVATDETVVFPVVWKGVYSLSVTKENFEPYSESGITIDENGLSTNVELTEIIMAPFNLQIDVPGENAILAWNQAPKNFFDDMEDHQDFIIENIGDYLLYDGDGQITWDLTNQNNDKYAFPNSGYAGSYIVFNPSATTPPIVDSRINPFSGSKSLNCMAIQGQNNDWLILPKQWIVEGSVLKFQAKSVTDQYGLERFKVAVSTTGANTQDFTVISAGEYVEATPAWTEYTYDLSAYAGQRIHVAIICVSNEAYVFMLDDIFLGVPEEAEPSNRKSFESYTVFLNGEEVATDLSEHQYEFTGLTIGETYTAGVQAVYSSDTSVVVTLDFKMIPAGIETIRKDVFSVYPNPVTDLLNIQTEQTITEIAVLDQNGKIVKNVKGNQKTVNLQALPDGYYIVRIHTATGITPIKIVKH